MFTTATSPRSFATLQNNTLPTSLLVGLQFPILLCSPCDRRKQYQLCKTRDNSACVNSTAQNRVSASDNFYPLLLDQEANPFGAAIKLSITHSTEYLLKRIIQFNTSTPLRKDFGENKLVVVTKLSPFQVRQPCSSKAVAYISTSCSS